MKCQAGQGDKCHEICLLVYFSGTIFSKSDKNVPFWCTRSVFFSARIPKICLLIYFTGALFQQKQDWVYFMVLGVPKSRKMLCFRTLCKDQLLDLPSYAPSFASPLQDEFPIPFIFK